ncbi:unnamed protein product [Cladocopium goreaui]|uniref:Uncharacterized protein n=1 Tax=Cladocopium goreaui TaxID=2562237 RepID=A0A9P1DTZ7_9DINO|nr:unnamed protein product [Cladocopium goreaui]
MMMMSRVRFRGTFIAIMENARRQSRASSEPPGRLRPTDEEMQRRERVLRRYAADLERRAVLLRQPNNDPDDSDEESVSTNTETVSVDDLEDSDETSSEDGEAATPKENPRRQTRASSEPPGRLRPTDEEMEESAATSTETVSAHDLET